MEPVLPGQKYTPRKNVRQPKLSHVSVSYDPLSTAVSEYAVVRKHVLKWLFHQEKPPFTPLKKVYVYSETALEVEFSTKFENTRAED